MDEFMDDPTLVDPDVEDEASYSWDEEFQRHIIALLMSDRQFLLQSLDLVKPTYFTNKAHQKACAIVYKFFREYRVIPCKDFVVQEIKIDLKDNKSLDYYLGEFNVIYDYFQPGLDAREYLQDKITYFAKIQAVKKAFHESLREIDKSPESEETWAKVYDMMRESMTTHQNFEIGEDYFKSIKDRYAAMAEDDEEKSRFVWGLESIDKEINGGGYLPGMMVSVVAGSGVGKSVLLACLTATNLLRGKKGVYVTLELPERTVADRMDAILTGFPVQNLIDHKDAIYEKLTRFDTVEYPSDEKGIGALVIKHFPGGSASVNTLRAYLSQLRFRGFEPDFMIVDYVGEMQDVPGIKVYESRERLVKELRGMASEEELFIATAMQPNRDAKRDQKQGGHNSRIDDEHLGDSFGQIRPLDGCFSMMQTDAEKEMGVGRGYVIKQRDGKSRYQIWLRFDKESLKITEISGERYRQIMSVHREKVEDDVVIDHVSKRTEEDKIADAVGGGTAWAPGDDETIGDNSEDKTTS